MDRLAENDFSARVDVLRKEVIANVSHELRSQLSVISGYAELVRDIHWKDEAAIRPRSVCLMLYLIGMFFLDLF